MTIEVEQAARFDGDEVGPLPAIAGSEPLALEAASLRRPGEELDEADLEAPSFDDLLARGRAGVAAGDLTAARKALRAAVDLDPDRREPQLELCRLAYRQFDWMELYSRTSAYLARRPSDREMMLLHARASNGLGNWASAVDSWGKVAEDRPDWPEPPFQIAKAHIRLGDRDAASNLARTLAAATLETPEAGAYAARLFVELDELQAAIATFQQLYRTAPELAAREFDLLDRQNDSRGLAIALSARVDVEGLRGGDNERLLNVSEALFRDAITSERAGDLLAAFLNYEALLVLTPEDGLARRSSERIARDLRFRAEDAMARQDTGAAMEAFADASRAAPADNALKRSYGRVLMRQREWTRAEAVWREFRAASPNDAEGALQLARALDRSGRFSEAISAWREVLELSPENAEALENLSNISRRMTFAGRTAISEERFLDAYALFKTVTCEAPGDEEGRRRLDQVGRNLLKTMRAAYKSGDLRSVLRCADPATDLLPQDPEVHLLIGRAASGMRRGEIGLKAWARLAELEPERRVLCSLQMARCHLQLGAMDEGQRLVGEVLVEDPENTDARELMDRLQSGS